MSSKFFLDKVERREKMREDFLSGAKLKSVFGGKSWKEVSKQKIHRNVNYSSIMVEFAATQLLK